MSLGTCHLSFISKHSHELTVAEFHVAQMDSGENLAFTFINPNLSDLRRHRAKICRSYYHSKTQTAENYTAIQNFF